MTTKCQSILHAIVIEQISYVFSVDSLSPLVTWRVRAFSHSVPRPQHSACHRESLTFSSHSTALSFDPSCYPREAESMWAVPYYDFAQAFQQQLFQQPLQQQQQASTASAQHIMAGPTYKYASLSLTMNLFPPARALASDKQAHHGGPSCMILRR